MPEPSRTPPTLMLLRRILALPPDITTTQRMILTTYAYHAGPDLTAHPSQGLVAAEGALGRRTVQRGIGALADRGLMLPAGQGRGVPAFRLELPAPDCDESGYRGATVTRGGRHSDAGGAPQWRTNLSVNLPVNPLSSEGGVRSGRSARGRGGTAGERSQIETAARHGGKATDLTQLPLLPLPEGELAVIEALLPAESWGEFRRLVGVWLRVHGPGPVGVFLREAAAWPLARWEGMKSLAGYCGACVGRIADEHALAASRERARRAEMEVAEARRAEEAEADRMKRAAADARERALEAAWASLDAAERQARWDEATGRLPAILRRSEPTEPRAQPFRGATGRHLAKIMDERSAG